MGLVSGSLVGGGVGIFRGSLHLQFNVLVGTNDRVVNLLRSYFIMSDADVATMSPDDKEALTELE